MIMCTTLTSWCISLVVFYARIDPVYSNAGKFTPTGVITVEVVVVSDLPRPTSFQNRVRRSLFQPI